MKKSLKSKIVIGVPVIFIAVMLIVVFVVSVILDQQHQKVANTFLRNAFNIIRYTISEKQEKLLFDSRQMASLDNMGIEIKYAKESSEYFKFETLRPTYIKIASVIYNISATTDVWKAKIYNSDADLVAFTIIDKSTSTIGFIHNQNNIEIATLKSGEELASASWVKQNNLPAGIEYSFAKAIIDKEAISFEIIDNSLCLVAYTPVMAKKYNPLTEKMEPSQVGMIVAVQKLGTDFVQKMSELSGTDVNIYTSSGMVVGTLEGYKTFDLSRFGSKDVESDWNLNRQQATYDEVRLTKGSYFQGILPVYYDSGCIAAIVSLYSKAIARVNTAQIVQLLSAVYLIGIVLIVPLTILVVVRGIINPIERIASMMREVARKKDFSKVLDIKRQDEIGDLASSFNEMNQNLQKTTTSIDNLNREITERKRVEGNLRKAEENYRRQFEGAMDAIFVADAETGMIVDCNPAATKLVGREKSELVGQHQQILHPSEGIEEEFSRTFKEHIEEKRGQVLEAQIITKEKGLRDVAIKANLIEIAGKKVIQGIFRDITERKKADRELQDAYLKLKRMQDIIIQAEKLNAVGRLASGVAHEVKNPLGIMLQGINYLEGKISSKEKDVFETFTMLKGSIERADKIIASLLDFSRVQKVDLQPQDINSILEDSLNLVKQRLNFEHIEIVKEMKKDIPKVLVDKNKIEQVFINIFLNAIQAIPERGRIIIRSYDTQLKELRSGVGKRKEDYFVPGEKAVEVEVEDTGVGISEENLKRIFDPFFTTKSPGGGSGLGLYVTQSIIYMHRGLINIESQKGKGTKVIITLKIARGQ